MSVVIPSSPQNAIWGGRTSKTFTDFSSDINLLTEVPTSGSAQGSPARHVRVNVVGSGVLAVEYEDGSTDAIPGCQLGEHFDMIVAKIRSSGHGTSVTSVTVWW